MPDFLDFRKFRGGNDSKTTSSSSNPTKKDQNATSVTPLERMLENAGPIRQDGSDKFFGMENFGNTCYCNSILQCLYYTPAFRDNVLSYPERSTVDVLTAAAATATPRQPYRLQNGVLVRPGQPQPQPKVITPTSQPGQKPEDKDSPEYKKKLALVAGPIVNLTYQNNTSYDMPETMFTSLKDLFEAVVANQNRHGVVSPTRFLEVLKRDNEMFRSAMHQDAHEFLNLLLNTVLESIEAHEKHLDEKPVDKSIEFHITAPKTENPTVSWPSILPQSEKKSHTKWLRDMFEGTLTSETRCLTCETTSHRDEPFLDLSVDLEQHSSITSCLNHFSQEEMLCERNKFHCDNCGGLQEAEKRMKIKKLPQILALHLKRFKYTEDLARLQKLFHKVVYPYHLRLFNTTDEAEDPDRLYELYGVVVHIGGGPYHGHYVSIIKTEDRGWLLFDDEMVEPVDRTYVRNFFGDKSGLACAYVLFYRATTEEQVYREAMIPSKGGGASQALNHEQSIRAEEAAEMHRVYSATTQPSPLETSHFLNLDHAVTAPQFSPNGHIEIPQSPNVLLSPGGTVTQTKKEKAKEEKERKAAEKAAEKERERAEKQRKKDLEQKPRKSEEDRRNGVVEDEKEGQTNGLSGLDIFRRSKSIRFGGLGRKEKSSWSSTSAIDDSAGQSAAPSFAASSQTTVDDHPSQDSVGNVAIERDKEKEKKNRFSFRKKSDVMR